VITRRSFLAAAGTTGLAACARPPAGRPSVIVNDVHSRLNATPVARVARPRGLDELAAAVGRARDDGAAVSVMGGRHAMGGQQFAADSVLIDTTGMDRVLAFDPERGLITVEAGIQWPALMTYLLAAQVGQPVSWGIAQKQTGADRLSLGGAVAANVHGRGLTMPPFVSDIEELTVVDARGEARRCSRRENAELFSLVAGGYGLFGPVASLTLRLARRRKLERVVEVIDMETLADRFQQRIAQGFLYGDCQYATDPASEDFLRRGVFSCYRPVADTTPIEQGQKELSLDDWNRLLLLSHADKRRAFELYAGYYLGTNGQIYWSDTHQLSVYVDDYHTELDQRLGATTPATEVITELYVPRPALGRFLADVRRDVRANGVNVIYGTVRLIERDAESFLPWARQAWACVIFNIHVEHSPAGLARSADDFRRLIDHARALGGSYFLTYHRHATRAQVEASYPRFAEFLRLKRRHDPEERFQSEWYRHYRGMFADALRSRVPDAVTRV
jgi:FAD/FMN-containing dehydrogenase